MLGLLAQGKARPEIHGGVARPDVSRSAFRQSGRPEALLVRVAPWRSMRAADAPARLAEESSLNRPRARRFAASTWTFAGRVVDLDGRALGGHRVGVHGGEARARTAADGSFEFEALARSASPWSREPGFVTVAATRASRHVASVVVVAPSQSLAVQVASAKTGEPISAARIQPIMSPALQARLGDAGVGDIDLGHGAHALALPVLSTGRGGSALFGDLPMGEWVQFHVSRPGYHDAVLSATVDGFSEASLNLVPIEVKRWIDGCVTSAAGEPVGGVQLRAGDATCRSRRDGTYRLGIVDVRASFLDAHHPTLGSARLPLDGVMESSGTSRVDVALALVEASTQATPPKSKEPASDDLKTAARRHPMTGLRRSHLPK